MFKFLSKKQGQKPAYAYNPETERAVIRASICNGEQVAGFKNKVSGEFHEVTLIRNSQELADFMKLYGIDHIDKEY